MNAPTTDIFTVEQCGKVHVITILIPQLSSASSEELSARLLSLLQNQNSPRFVLDFAQVRYMESSAIGALVTFLKWLARCDGRVVIANVNENVRFLFAVTKLDKVFPLLPDVPSAMAAAEA
jgi:anti-sigma B factor antagonist